MAATAKVYGLALTSAFTGKINLASDQLKLMLCTSGYTPDQDTHQFKSSVTNEITGTGYTAGGINVGPVTISYNGSTNRWSFDAPDVAWSSATFTGVRYAILYDAAPATDATRPLLLCIDYGSDQAAAGGSFPVTFDAAGILEIPVAG